MATKDITGLVTGKKDAKTGNNRSKDTQFKKGVSGNPSGRPKKTEEQKKADEEAENALNMLKNALPKAISKVLELLDDPQTPPNTKVKIAEMMLDRTYGKAFQAVQTDDLNVKVEVSYSDPEMEALSV